jgi:uncharacterized protein
MGNEKNFAIAHVGLKKEIHHFEYLLDESFFTHAESLAIVKSNIHVNVSLDKRYEPHVIDMLINGTYTTSCDRCAALVDIPIVNNHSIYVKYSEDIEEQDIDDEDIIVISRDDAEIDLYPFLHDYVYLCLPISNKCSDPGNTIFCDKEVVKILENLSVKEEQSDQKNVWEVLNKLKDLN